MNRKLSLSWPDVVGILSSSLCIVHCMAMPFLIATGVSILSNEWLTYLFIIISFFSIYKATKNCVNLKVGALLWVSFFGFLLTTFFHEQSHVIHLLNYVFAFAIVVGHVLNIKYCKQCKR